jgi:dTDP-4-amino-4,6-dideoxygalactose transaminase
MREAVAGGKLSGDGPFTRKCHALLEKELGVGRVLLTTSCSHALEMTAVLLDLKPGDEVIIPAFTFVSVANAFVLRGARPVFSDVRSDTLNVDETKLESLITPRTRAIVVVHYAGVACEMDAILEVAGRHGIPVVEDNAHGLFGKYKGRFLGTLGSMATQSFHETKNFTCGEGGALLINDPHPRLDFAGFFFRNALQRDGVGPAAAEQLIQLGQVGFVLRDDELATSIQRYLFGIAIAGHSLVAGSR